MKKRLRQTTKEQANDLARRKNLQEEILFMFGSAPASQRNEEAKPTNEAILENPATNIRIEIRT